MIGNDWDNILDNLFKNDKYLELIDKINNEYNNKIIYPEKDNIYNALKLTSYNDALVVIVGQDPYHGEGEAHGLSFSVQKGIKLPPSLKNIYKELKTDLDIDPVNEGDLTKWAKQGVLLLNSTLTVEKDKPASHSKMGWDLVTNEILSQLNKKNNIVFILWGNFAKSKKVLLDNPNNLIIESAHPSPFSARNGFFGSKPFSKTNVFLKSHNNKEIDWNLL